MKVLTLRKTINQLRSIPLSIQLPTHLLSHLSWGAACIGLFACASEANEKVAETDVASSGGQQNGIKGDADDSSHGGSGGSDSSSGGDANKNSSCQELALCCPRFMDSIDRLRCTGVIEQDQEFACSGMLVLYNEFCEDANEGSGGDGGAAGTGGAEMGDDCFDDDADSDTPCVARSVCDETVLSVEATGIGQDRVCGEWVMQFGSGGYTRNHGLALDDEGNVYAVGDTVGALANAAHFGEYDAYVQKLSASDGSTISTLQFGSTADDYANGVAPLGSGNLLLVGATEGDLTAGASTGYIFTRRLSSNGTPDWTTQFGGETGFDNGRVIVRDTLGNIYIAGDVYETLPGQESAGQADVWVRKISAETGSAEWTIQLGSGATDYAKALVVDPSGNVILGAYSAGGVWPEQLLQGSEDSVVVKLSKTDGSVMWIKQFGTPRRDRVQGLAVDSDRVYAVGASYDAFTGQSPGGDSDAFAAAFSLADGEEEWWAEFGTMQDDFLSAVELSADGLISFGDSAGREADRSLHFRDLILVPITRMGVIGPRYEFGTSGDDFSTGLRLGAAGEIYISGETTGAFPGYANPGMIQSYVARLPSLQ